MLLDEAMKLLLVLVRVGCIFAFLPFLGETKAPMAMKGLAVVAISLVILPVSGARVPAGAWQPVRFFLFVGAEVLLGLLIGVSARVVFSSIRIAGEMIGRQIGMALAITADPISGVQATPIGNFAELVGVLTLFSMGGHHMMLRALRESFAHWPLGTFVPAELLRDSAVGAGSACFSMALQIAAPLLLLTFLVSLVMAVMARLVPEVNILVVGFPLRIGAGLIGLTLMVPLLVQCSNEVARATLRLMWSIATRA
ncbi:MAG: flagellar biosynthetic protein FliR [Candidatus Brocadiia bacterium]